MASVEHKAWVPVTVSVPGPTLEAIELSQQTTSRVAALWSSVLLGTAFFPLFIYFTVYADAHLPVHILVHVVAVVTAVGTASYLYVRSHRPSLSELIQVGTSRPLYEKPSNRTMRLAVAVLFMSLCFGVLAYSAVGLKIAKTYYTPTYVSYSDDTVSSPSSLTSSSSSSSSSSTSSSATGRPPRSGCVYFCNETFSSPLLPVSGSNNCTVMSDIYTCPAGKYMFKCREARDVSSSCILAYRTAIPTSASSSSNAAAADSSATTAVPAIAYIVYYPYNTYLNAVEAMASVFLVVEVILIAFLAGPKSFVVDAIPIDFMVHRTSSAALLPPYSPRMEEECDDGEDLVDAPNHVETASGSNELDASDSIAIEITQKEESEGKEQQRDQPV